MKRQGTHRLVIDCDTLVVKSPNFDLNCDWQASFNSTNQNINKKYLDYIINSFDYNIDTTRKYKMYDMHKKYIEGYSHEHIYPHFNIGVLLMKENICKTFVELYKPAFTLYKEENWKIQLPQDIDENFTLKYYSNQLSKSFSLITLSSNWKPLDPGINYLIYEHPRLKLKKEDISIVHYCGPGALRKTRRLFPEFFI